MFENGTSLRKQMAGYTWRTGGRARGYNFDKFEEGRIVSHMEFHWRMAPRFTV